ncbi:hypothetical protein AGOR_G00189340 [Albula goreensis]|uniref:Uncharacterized protein n=1 Tax=Albula goreensis TaxID=1534307 RepID=A0A8T3CVP9_9TELE|nr:hypothetical protein AGOR_G00189340 [Albula goreensis]
MIKTKERTEGSCTTEQQAVPSFSLVNWYTFLMHRSYSKGNSPIFDSSLENSSVALALICLLTQTLTGSHCHCWYLLRNILLIQALKDEKASKTGPRSSNVSALEGEKASKVVAANRTSSFLSVVNADLLYARVA